MAKTPKSPFKEFGLDARQTMYKSGYKKKRWHGDRSKKAKQERTLGEL